MPRKRGSINIPQEILVELAEEAIKEPRDAKAALRSYRKRRRESGEKMPWGNDVLLRWIRKYQPRTSKHKTSVLDREWSLAALTLPGCSLSPQGLVAVWRAFQGRHVIHGDFESTTGLSIREALWIDRLYPLYEDADKARAAAIWYAVREAAYEAMGKKDEFDTSDLDAVLLKPSQS